MLNCHTGPQCNGMEPPITHCVMLDNHWYADYYDSFIQLIICFFDSRFFQNSLLHLAARGHVESVLPLVVQAYKRAKLFSTAMAIKNGSGWNPLHEAVRSCNFENTVFLFKECLENYPEAFEPTDNGELHVVLGLGSCLHM